jgi:hypothetical protein
VSFGQIERSSTVESRSDLAFRAPMVRLISASSSAATSQQWFLEVLAEIWGEPGEARYCKARPVTRTLGCPREESNPTHGLGNRCFAPVVPK